MTEQIQDKVGEYCSEKKQRLKEYNRLYHASNKEKNKKQRSDYAREYYKRNKIKASKRYQNNITKIKVYQKQYQKANRQKFKEQYNKSYKNDELFRAKAKLRASVCHSFKRIKLQKITHTEKLLGCSWQQAKEHLESLFQPGMTWGNHGEWHIDHIIPIATATTAEDVAKLCHISNLQPLWAVDNLLKGCKVDYYLLNDIKNAHQYLNI